MSALLAVDTNAYVEILRRSARGERLRALLSRERSRLVVLMPVMLELLQGVRTSREERVVMETLVGAVPPNRRITPTGDEWLDTGRALARLAAGGHDPAELRQRSFFLDVQIAVLCRKRGIALVTDDRDHERLRVHVGHTVLSSPD